MADIIFFHLMFFYEHVNICIIIAYIMCNKKSFMFWVYKKIYSFLFSPTDFFIRKFIRVAEFFLREEDNWLKRTYVEGVGDTCKTKRDGQGRGGGGGVKNWKFGEKILFEWPLAISSPNSWSKFFLTCKKFVKS